MNSYYSGIIFGLSLALIIAAIMYLKNKNQGKFKYDERQMIGRGKAFQAGFFTLLIADAFLNIWEYIEGSLPGTPFLWHIGVLFLGVAVFALTAIHYDAYVSMNDTPKHFYKIGGCFMVAMVLLSYANLRSEHNEGHIVGLLNLGVAVLWFIIVTGLYIHRIRTKAEEQE